MKKTTISLLGVVAAVAMISVIASQEAYAHGNVKIPFTISNGETRTIEVVLGHTNEPTFGVSPGIWDGLHGIDIIIRDVDTNLPISGASLTADKYFFKNQKRVDKASSPDDADSKDLGVSVSGVFGDPGRYIVRQMIKDGIYGYHISGTVTYFDGTEVPVDFTGFCRDAAKFNSADFERGYGCPGDIKDIKFPKKGHHSGNFDKEDEDD